MEKNIALLESGTGGLAFASGMAAITAVLSLFKSGDKIIIPTNLYGGTFRVIDKVFKNFNLIYEIVDFSRLSDEKELIGNTPLIKLTHIDVKENVNIFAKLECFNPGGSIKYELVWLLLKELKGKDY